MGTVSMVFLEKFQKARLQAEARQRLPKQFAQGLDHVEGTCARRVKCASEALHIFWTVRYRHGA
jgi:hypothetical protein